MIQNNYVLLDIHLRNRPQTIDGKALIYCAILVMPQLMLSITDVDKSRGWEICFLKSQSRLHWKLAEAGKAVFTHLKVFMQDPNSGGVLLSQLVEIEVFFEIVLNVPISLYPSSRPQRLVECH